MPLYNKGGYFLAEGGNTNTIQYHDPLVYSSDYRSQMSKFCMISLPLEIKLDNPVDIHNSSISMKPLLMHQEGMNLRCRPQLPKNLHHVYFPSSVCTIEAWLDVKHQWSVPTIYFTYPLVIWHRRLNTHFEDTFPGRRKNNVMFVKLYLIRFTRVLYRYIYWQVLSLCQSSHINFPLASATQRRAAAVFSGRLADKIVLATSKECRIKAFGKIDSGIKIMRIYVSPNVVISFNIWVMRI